MSFSISPMADYIQKNPNCTIPAKQVEHEWKYFHKRERVASLAALGCGALAVVAFVVALFGILSAGHVLAGAFAAAALCFGLYSYMCRQAVCSLSLQWSGPARQPDMVTFSR